MKKIIIIFFVFSMLEPFLFFVNGQQQNEKKQKVKLIFTERVRLTAFDNSITLDKNTEPWVFSRWRTFLGLNYSPTDNFSMMFQLANESRYWFAPASKETKFDEIFVNQLYIDWKRIGNSAFDLKIGRQNIMLDEGFICLDGQPLTGSRSAYFNAIRSDFHINDKQTLMAFFSYNPRTDDLLPVINEQDPAQVLEEQGNRGIGVYYTSKWKALSKLSLYYFYKNTITDNKHPLELKRHALGGRLALTFAEKWNFTTEAAYQFGKTADENHSAYGGYLKLGRKIDEIPIFKGLTLGSFYLSGDDPTTSKTEGWDPLWSRFPKWSESYIYTLIIENKGKVAYWSNMASLYVEAKGKLSEKLSFKSAYHYLLAPQDNESKFCSGDGKHRGNLFIFRANYKIDKHWSGHLLWENFNVGDFYYSAAEGYNWVRFELMYKF